MISKIEIYLLRVVHFIFKFLGLAPSNVNILPSNRGKKQFNQVTVNFTMSTTGSIISIIIFLVLLMQTYIIVQEHIVKYSDWPGQHDHFLKSIVLIGYLEALFILSFFNFNHKTLLTIVNRIILLEVELDKKLAKFKQMNTGKLWLIIPFIVHIFMFIFLIIIAGLIDIDDIIPTIGKHLRIFFLTSFIVQFSILIRFLRRILSNLNKSLHSLVTHDTDSGRQLIIIASSQQTETSIRSIQLIAKSQRTLCELFHDLSNFYSWPMLLVNSYFCIIMIYAAYDLVLPFTSPTPFGSTFIMIKKVLQIATFLIPVLILCLNLTAMITETQKTSIVIHQLMETQKTHTRTRYELEQFSLELLHRDMSFNACGLFSIDNSFLVSIAGTVITYVMIMIQYDQSLATEDENYWNISTEISNDIKN